MAARYQKIADILRSEIRSGIYEINTQLPTEQALCARHQASRQTIRKALSVLVAEGLIEKHQGSGSWVRDMSHTPPAPIRSIAVVTTYISDYIFPGILREVETVLSQNNCTTLLFATQNQVSNERKVLLNILSQPHIDGVMVEGTKSALPNPNLDLYQKLRKRKIPLVFINGCYQELDSVVSVMDDNYGGGYMLTKYLLDKGHTRIAGIFKNDDIQGHQRYAGYAAALRDAGSSVQDEHLYWYDTETKSSFTAGEPCPPRMLAALDGCTAAVCYNDEIASFLIRALLHTGVRIPEDLAVVSFDNSQYSELCPRRITSLSHGANNVGRIAAEMLLKCLDGKSCASKLVPWAIVEKESG